jgi:hypothetical protein
VLRFRSTLARLDLAQEFVAGSRSQSCRGSTDQGDLFGEATDIRPRPGRPLRDLADFVEFFAVASRWSATTF